jgi:hypothetical protein
MKENEKKNGTAVVRVYGTVQGFPIALAGAEVVAHRDGKKAGEKKTGPDGSCSIPLEEGSYEICATFAMGDWTSEESSSPIHVCEDKTAEMEVHISLSGSSLSILASEDGLQYSKDDPIDLRLRYRKPSYLKFDWPVGIPVIIALAASGAIVKQWAQHSVIFEIIPTSTAVRISAAMSARDNVKPQPPRPRDDGFDAPVTPPDVTSVEGDVSVSLRRTASRMTEDVSLWVAIRNSTDTLSFDRYFDFMEWLFCKDDTTAGPFDISYPKARRRMLPFTDTDAYRNVKAATEAFVMANCGVTADGFDADDARYVKSQLVVDVDLSDLVTLFDSYLESAAGPGSHVLPYLALIRRKLKDEGIKKADIGDQFYKGKSGWQARADTCYGVLKRRLECPLLMELIWSYWQEEGMLTQTMNAITRRFQNVRAPLANDPLANTEIDPLRPLNNVLWGYIQDEQHRLSVVRRNYEYDHHYGLRLAGKAVRDVRTADSRSRFLEAFHTLLSIVSSFYKRDDDTTIVADGYPVLNALKEAHLILSQGAHNQFGDLPSTARIEMLMQQWILARPEFREFLPTRIMVAYPEPWMDRVDAMKKLQGWSDTSVLHFRNLAMFGEQILLSIRYGAWAGVNDQAQAVNWARYWRPEVQGYLHAYRSATGIDLSLDVANARVDATMPSLHLVRRLEEQRRTA